MHHDTLILALATTIVLDQDNYPVPHILVKNVARRLPGSLPHPNITVIELPQFTLRLNYRADDGSAPPWHTLTRHLQTTLDNERRVAHVVTQAGKLRTCPIPSAWHWSRSAFLAPVEILTTPFSPPYLWLSWPTLRDQKNYRFWAKLGMVNPFLKTIADHLALPSHTL